MVSYCLLLFSLSHIALHIYVVQPELSGLKSWLGHCRLPELHSNGIIMLVCFTIALIFNKNTHHFISDTDVGVVFLKISDNNYI